MIEISHRQLEPAILDNLLTKIVLREGADYGNQEISVDDKKKKLLQQLEIGKVVLMFDAAEGFCDVASI